MAKTSYVKKKTKAGYRCYRVGLKHKPVKMSFCKKGTKRSGGKKRSGGSLRCVSPHFIMSTTKGPRCACVAKSSGGAHRPKFVATNSCNAKGWGKLTYKQAVRKYVGPAEAALVGAKKTQRVLRDL